MKITLAFLIGLILSVGGFFVYQWIHPVDQALSGFSDPFVSIQLAASPSNGDCLITDGTNNSWDTCTGASGSIDGTGTTSQLAYFTDSNTLTSIATGTLSASSPLSLTGSTVIVGTSRTLSLDTSGAWSGTAGSLAANGANCSSGNSPLGVDASGAVESCFDVWTEAENTSAAYLKNIVEDLTPQLGAELDAQTNDIVNLGDVTFQTGAQGGTLRTGTSNADKFNLEAYDVNGGVYVDMFRVDAGNDVTAEFPYLTSNGFLKTSGGTGLLSVDTNTYLTTVDISDNTNLSGDTEIVLTGDALSLGNALTFTTGTSSTAFQTALLGVGLDYLSDITGTGIVNNGGSLEASLGTDIAAGEIANGDHGIFSYSSGVASLDANGLTSTNVINALTDESGTGGVLVTTNNPLFGGFRSSASSTIDALTVTTGTTTNATSTSLFSTLATFTNSVVNTLLTAVSATITNLTATNATLTNATTTNATSTNLYVTSISEPDDLFKFSIASTTNKFATGTVSYLPMLPYASTVTDIDCFVVGGTSKVILILGEAITCDADGAADDGSIAITNITAGSTTVSYTASTTVGVVNDVFITVYGRKAYK